MTEVDDEQPPAEPAGPDHQERPVEPVAATTGAVGEEWSRLHPSTPFVRGWRSIVAVLVIGLQDGLAPRRLALTGGLVLVVAVTFGIGFFLNWRVSRYRLEGPDLVVETGVVHKRSRRVPLARLQAVDVVRPLVARALGVAELRLEVAGGKESNASLAYLDDATAALVRNDLLVLAAGLRDDVATEPSPPEALESPIAETPTGRLLAATMLSGPGPLVILVLAGAVAAGLATGEIATAIGILVPVLFGFGGQIWTGFAKNYGSALADAPDGLRVRRGLLETRSQTVPPGRVQGVVVAEPLLFRLFGWVKLEATVAGYGNGGSGSAALLPVAPSDTTTEVTRRILPGVEWREVRLVPVPARARWRAPMEARRLGAGLGDRGAERVLVTRRGRLVRRTDIVPLARIQSIRLRQGPLQRRLRLATVFADTSSGPVKAAALHRDEREARELADTLVVESRAARAAARPDRWLAGTAG